ncbi:MAG: DsrE family protein [Gammaproteobacteria bacterium]
MHPLPSAAFQPDKTATYKALFVIDHNAKDPSQINSGFEHVAMAVNVFDSAGVPPQHLQFVVIVRGAVPAVLDNAQYRKQFHIDNPNLKVISELEAAGVQIAVCGQAVAGWNEDYSSIDPRVKVALSGLSTIVILQHEGYALMQL